MNRRKFLATTAAAGLTILAAPHVARAAVTRRLRFGQISGEKSPNGLAVNAFAKAAAELTGGSIEVQTFHSSTIGKAGELVAGIQDATIDLIALATDTMKGVPPEVMALTTPFLFKSRADAHAALDGALGALAAEALAPMNIKVLGWAENGLRHVTAKRPIRRPEDLAGLKIRVPEAPVSVAAFKALGAEPMAIPFAELSAKLQSGVVEAQENPVGNIVNAKFEGLMSHISLTGHIYSPTMIAISAEIAAELSAAENAALFEAARRASKVGRDANAEVDVKGLATMAANGWTVVSDVDVAAFQARSADIDAAVAEVVGADVLAKIKGIVS